MLEEFKDIDTIVYRQLYNGLKKTFTCIFV